MPGTGAHEIDARTPASAPQCIDSQFPHSQRKPLQSLIKAQGAINPLSQILRNFTTPQSSSFVPARALTATVHFIYRSLTSWMTVQAPACRSPISSYPHLLHRLSSHKRGSARRIYLKLRTGTEVKSSFKRGVSALQEFRPRIKFGCTWNWDSAVCRVCVHTAGHGRTRVYSPTSARSRRSDQIPPSQTL